MEEVVGPLQDLFQDLQRQWKSFQDAEPFIDVVRGFVHAIDWREPWIMCILGFHVVMLVAALTTRKRGVLQAIIFTLAAGLIYTSEQLNRQGSTHWQSFASQNYFDAAGVFTTAVLSGPLLLVMFVVLINYLLNCATMLIEAKKRELIYKAKQRAKDEKAKDGAAGTKKDK